MLNIVDEIFRNADAKALALIAGDRCMTYAELKTLVEEGSRMLGPRASQRIGLVCPNGIHHIVWSLAVLRSGGVLVPIASELSHPERDAVVNTTALNAILTAGGKDWHHETANRHTLALQDMPAVLHDVTGIEASFAESELTALNPALIRFSSGTTGHRKGVVLSHETLLARVKACNAGLGIGPGDRVIWTLPMAHHFAVSIVLYLLHGATTVLEDSHLAEDVYRALTAHAGTVLYGSPFHYALLAAYEKGRPVASLRLAVSTAATLPKAVAEQFHARYELPLRQGMGIIEVGLPLLNMEHALDKPESVGKCQPGFEFRIGDEGELLLRGPGLFDAYLSPWTPRAEVLRDGWFATGDLARADDDGSVYLIGRTHSVINVGGMKCFPEEVEAVLCQHPQVAEARVIPMANSSFGSVPVAEIVPCDPTSPPKNLELTTLCRRELSSYKVPVRYVMVAAIPKTPSGKVSRQA
jgi:long-chain acyl-CoA synthetase